MNKFCTVTILDHMEIAPKVCKMTLKAPEIAKNAKAGQFIQMYPTYRKNMLGRPISLSSVSEDNVNIVYRVVGEGTRQFSKLRKNDSIQVIGPLGNGFTLSDSIAQNIIVGGGMGIPPLLELAKRLSGKVDVFLGYSDIQFLAEEFKKFDVNLHIASQSGKYGFHGTVVDLIENIVPLKGQMFACGPRPMLKSVSIWAKNRGYPIQISMEERMACGIGACLGCGIKIQKIGESDWTYRRVCRDGPVFLGEEVIWDE